MTKQEELEQMVIESGSLADRLIECRRRIGKMCKERRPPKMTIPVQWDDDDFFISTTLDDAIHELHELERKIKLLERIIGEQKETIVGFSETLKPYLEDRKATCPVCGGALIVKPDGKLIG